VPGSSADNSRAFRALLWKTLTTCRPLRRAAIIGFPLVIVSRLAGIIPAASTQILVDDVVGRGRADLLWVYLAVTIGAIVIHGVGALMLARVANRAQEQFTADFRVRLHAHLLSLPLRFHDTNKTGALVSTVMNDVQSFARAFSLGAIDLGGAIIGATVAFVILARIDVGLATTALAIILFHTFLSQSAVRRAKTLYEAAAQAKAEGMARLNESLAGVRVVKAYAAEPRERTAFSARVERICETQVTALFTSARLRAFSTVIASFGFTFLLAASAVKVTNGDMTIGGLMTFSSVLFMLTAPIAQLANMTPQLSESMSGAERTLALLAREREGASEQRVVRLPPIAGRVVFESVSFAYRPGHPVLNDISFTVEPGTVTALVSRSGGGKSTTAALLASLYPPDSGRITVDGHDLQTVDLESYRRQLGIVLQETFLFDGTILENVALSRHDVSKGEILRVCALARVDEFAERLPDGYKTLVGERGAMLSGGERQRIAIARALLVDPRLLILDEPTFGLDAHAEDLVYAALVRLMQGRTTLIISHRLSRVRMADQIIVLESGRIIERGTHAELAESSRVYRALAEQSADDSAFARHPWPTRLADTQIHATPSR
jgi:ABC-type multidrug transport system fused ATPase/permease subunit